MRSLLETRELLETERGVSQKKVADAQKILAAWSGGARTIDQITHILNQHWPRIAFLNALLTKQNISEAELTIVRKGTLTEEELRVLMP